MASTGINVDDVRVVLKCATCKTTQFLEKAALEGWRQCMACEIHICAGCIQEFQRISQNSGSPAVCPGPYLRFNHDMTLGPIPVADLIIMAQRQPEEPAPMTGILLQRAFYAKPVFSAQYIPEDSPDSHHPIISFDSKVAKVRQERWANMGTVIVRRNRGKFITWERLASH